MILRATITTLARVLGVRDDQAEGVLRSEASARAALSRRGLFRAAGAVTAGVAFGDALAGREPVVTGRYVEIVFGQGPVSAPEVRRTIDYLRALADQRGIAVLPVGVVTRVIEVPR